MPRQQAEAMARAVLEPDPIAQAALRRKREAEARSLSIRRWMALFALVGFAVGAAAAFALGERFTVGGLWAGTGGAAVGWAVGAWRNRRRAA